MQHGGRRGNLCQPRPNQSTSRSRSESHAPPWNGLLTCSLSGSDCWLVGVPLGLRPRSENLLNALPSDLSSSHTPSLDPVLCGFCFRPPNRFLHHSPQRASLSLRTEETRIVHVTPTHKAWRLTQVCTALLCDQRATPARCGSHTREPRPALPSGYAPSETVRIPFRLSWTATHPSAWCSSAGEWMSALHQRERGHAQWKSRHPVGRSPHQAKRPPQGRRALGRVSP